MLAGTRCSAVLVISPRHQISVPRVYLEPRKLDDSTSPFTQNHYVNLRFFKEKTSSFRLSGLPILTAGCLSRVQCPDILLTQKPRHQTHSKT